MRSNYGLVRFGDWTLFGVVTASMYLKNRVNWGHIPHISAWWWFRKEVRQNVSNFNSIIKVNPPPLSSLLGEQPFVSHSPRLITECVAPSSECRCDKLRHEVAGGGGSHLRTDQLNLFADFQTEVMINWNGGSSTRKCFEFQILDRSRGTRYKKVTHYVSTAELQNCEVYARWLSVM